MAILYNVVCLTTLWNPMLKKAFDALKKYFDPEELDLIDLKIKKIKYIKELRQSDPIRGVSDEAYNNPEYSKVQTTYEFLRDLSTLGMYNHKFR